MKKQVAHIRNTYEMLHPTNSYDIAVTTASIVGKAFLGSFLMLWFSLRVKGITLYHCIIIIFLVYLLNSGMVRYQLAKVELRLLLDLEKYLGDLRHYFYSNGMIEEAIYDSLEEANPRIALHMQKIHDILQKEDSFEVEQYKEVAPNKFFVTFLALCQVTVNYGDSIYKEQSLFLTNLNYLKNEINIEILKRQKMKHVFSGLIFITIMPIFFLKIIENWSISNLEELEKYYYGAYGLIVSIVIFLVTILCYQLIHKLKSNEKGKRNSHEILDRFIKIDVIDQLLTVHINKHYAKAKKTDYLIKRIGEGITLKQFMMQRTIIFFVAFICINGLIIHIISVTRDNHLNYVKDFEASVYSSERKDIDYYQKVIKEYCNRYKNKAFEKLKLSKIRSVLSENKKIHNPQIIEILAKEIMKRLYEFHNCIYHFYYLLISLILSAICCYLPYVILLCKKQLMQMSMEDEVMQFQAIIIMLIHIKRMNVETILDWIENFSEIFRPAIMECVDTYHYDEEMAFSILKEKEPFLPFVRIIENLEACDAVGIEKAFDEITSQRSYFIEKRKQENEIFITNKAVIGKVLAYIPMFLTLSLYLIIPFVLESITRLMSYINQMQVF